MIIRDEIKDYYELGKHCAGQYVRKGGNVYKSECIKMLWESIGRSLALLAKPQLETYIYYPIYWHMQARPKYKEFSWTETLDKMIRTKSEVDFSSYSNEDIYTLCSLAQVLMQLVYYTLTEHDEWLDKAVRIRLGRLDVDITIEELVRDLPKVDEGNIYDELAYEAAIRKILEQYKTT